jgi:hypothetical protein
VVFMFGVPLAVSAPAPADEKPSADKKSPFAGKVIVVRGHAWNLTVLEGVQVRQIGTKDFLVGKAAAVDNDNVSKGRQMWISLEAVDTVTEYDNLKDAKEAYENARQVPAAAAVPPVAAPPLPPPAPQRQ